MATIEKRFNSKGEVSYRVTVRIKGRPRCSATFRKKVDAVQWGRDTEAAIQQGRHLHPANQARKHTMSELLDRYQRDVIDKRSKNTSTLTQEIRWWREELGQYLIADITTAMIVECRGKLEEEVTCRGQVRSPATVNRYCSLLSNVFRIAIDEWEWLKESPMKGLKKRKESRGRTRFLSEDERHRLLLACQESKCSFLHTIVVLALATGMRKGEIMNLKWDDIDFERHCITLSETKNGEVRVVPLLGYALKLLRRHAEKYRFETILLFPGKKVAKPCQIRRSWENALKRADIEDFCFHDLRHSCASYLAMNGATMMEIAEILGHKTLSMVKRYAHLSHNHIKSVVERMNSAIIGLD